MVGNADFFVRNGSSPCILVAKIATKCLKKRACADIEQAKFSTASIQAALISSAGNSNALSSPSIVMCTRSRRRPPTPILPRSSVTTPVTIWFPKSNCTRSPTLMRRPFPFVFALSFCFLIAQSPRRCAQNRRKIRSHHMIKRACQTVTGFPPGAHSRKLKCSFSAKFIRVEILMRYGIPP